MQIRDFRLVARSLRTAPRPHHVVKKTLRVIPSVRGGVSHPRDGDDGRTAGGQRSHEG